MRSKELSVELRDRIVLRHRSGEGYQRIAAALKVPKNTVASIILKWKKFGTTKTLPRAGRPAKQAMNSTSMSEPKSTEALGSGCGVPAQRSSQQGPEVVSVKLEDCSQTLEVNVIVKEEEEERAVTEEAMERAFKEEAEESAIKEEEKEERAVTEEEEERAITEATEERPLKEEVKESGVKEEESPIKEENRDVSSPDLEEVDSITDPGEISNPGSDSESSSTASGNLKQHRRRNSRQKHHHCMDCFTSLYDPEELRRHTCRPHPCSDCRGSFICQIHLKSHQQTRRIKKTYPCDQCGKSFPTPN
ncbi:zinc finger and BTB domain-containing protein 17-like [Salvelinus alpinus]|uniref:zinc finger and BTB domain-containing protein 17-like n=1 Tax=Salvelinus alpinus TaxID=8036 RepID=UPI0039FD0C7F